MRPLDIRARGGEGGGGREFEVVGENVRDERDSSLKGGEGLVRTPKKYEVTFHCPFDGIKRRWRG